MTNFGASFKKARESKGISLDQIAKKTRISTRFLAAIEDEDFKVLPGGVFNRGFVRAFAESVGLDPDQAVSDYERLVTVREPNEILTSAKPSATVPSKTERNLYPIAIGVLVIAVAIFYLLTRESGRLAETPTAPPVVATPATPPPQTAQAVTPPPTTADATPASTEQTPAVSEPQQQATTAPALASPPPPTQALTLDIEVREKTWIKITADGKSVLPGEVLEPGMTRKFTAENSLGISIGNAAGLALKINDMPLKPLGKSGQVRSVTITPSNLKDFIG